MQLIRLTPLLLLITLYTGGCASGPAFSKNWQTVKPIATGKGRILFYAPPSKAFEKRIVLIGETTGRVKVALNSFVDLPPGRYEAQSATGLTQQVLMLAEGETKYVRFVTMMGAFIGGVIPKEVSEEVALREIADLKLSVIELHIATPVDGDSSTLPQARRLPNNMVISPHAIHKTPVPIHYLPPPSNRMLCPYTHKPFLVISENWAKDDREIHGEKVEPTYGIGGARPKNRARPQ